MSYTAITDAEVATGEPTTSSLMTKVKDGLESHELRLQDLEGGTAASPPPIILKVNGAFPISRALDGVVTSVLNFNLRVTGVRLIVDRAGTSGTTRIGLKFYRSGTWTSVLTTRPSLNASDGDYAVSSDAVIDTANDDLQAGDLIRLDIDSLQLNSVNFMLRIDYERT